MSSRMIPKSVSAAVLIAVPLLVVTMQNGIPVYVRRSLSEPTSFVEQQQTLYHNRPHYFCQSKLDELDDLWDKRQYARVDRIKDVTKPVPCYNSWGLFDFFEQEAVCFDDERFGTERYKAFGDGPKFLCGVDRLIEKANWTDECLIYSIGSNNEIDFELAVQKVIGEGANGKCELHTFDPTVRPEWFIGHNHTTFHDWGLGEEGKQTVIQHYKRGKFNFTEMSLKSVMQKLGHYKTRSIDVLKIDCEGCEFVALTEAFNAIAAGEIEIDQVQVEIHGGQGKKNSEFHFPLVKRLFEAADKANMRVFHKEGNSWGCKGFGCVEYAFASSNYLRKANSNYVC